MDSTSPCRALHKAGLLLRREHVPPGLPLFLNGNIAGRLQTMKQHEPCLPAAPVFFRSFGSYSLAQEAAVVRVSPWCSLAELASAQQHMLASMAVNRTVGYPLCLPISMELNRAVGYPLYLSTSSGGGCSSMISGQARRCWRTVVDLSASTVASRKLESAGSPSAWAASTQWRRYTRQGLTSPPHTRTTPCTAHRRAHSSEGQRVRRYSSSLEAAQMTCGEGICAG